MYDKLIKMLMSEWENPKISFKVDICHLATFWHLIFLRNNLRSEAPIILVLKMLKGLQKIACLGSVIGSTI